METKKNIAVMFGGPSVEHDVSVITGLQVIKNLDGQKYNILPLYWIPNGGFVLLRSNQPSKPYTDVRSLLHGNWLPIGFKIHGEIGGISIGFILKTFHVIDAAIPCFHGSGGEDGVVQGMLEAANIPYASPGVAASAIGMDKILFKAVMKQAGLPVLDFQAITKESGFDVKKLPFDFPVIVKPAHLGSSIGVKKCDNLKDVHDALEVIFELDTNALVEPYLEDRQEVNCSVLGTTETCQTSVCEEPISSEDILSFEDKYLKGGKGAKGTKSGVKGMAPHQTVQGMASLDRRIPAQIDKNLESRIKNLAIDCFKALGCSGVARVDFMVATNKEQLRDLQGSMIDKKTGNVYVTEINTIPGSLSFYLWEASGISFRELLDRLVEIAEFEYKKKKSLLRTFESSILDKQF